MKIEFKDSDFAEATGQLWAIEKYILTGDGVEKAIEAVGADEVLKSLAQSTGMDFSSIEKPSDYELVLKDDLKSAYELVLKISPDSRVVELLAAKYDYHNIKVAVKSKYLQKDFSYMYLDTSGKEPKIIAHAVESDNYDGVPEHLANAAKEAINACEKNVDPQIIDLVIDREMLNYVKALSDEIGNEYISKYFSVLIDFYNVKTLMRVKNMKKPIKFLLESLVDGGSIEQSLFIESFTKQEDVIAANFYYKYFGVLFKRAMEAYEKSQNFGALEKYMDNFIMEHVKQAKYSSFGPEPLFAYLLQKENEVRQIRILMTCKINNISNEVLRERLRDNYA